MKNVWLGNVFNEVPNPVFEEAFEYDDFDIYKMKGACSCVKHKEFMDPFAGCDACLNS